MGTVQTYRSLEHTMMHSMRRAISRARDSVDLGNQFSYVIADFLRKAFPDNGNMIRQNDVAFSAQPASHYTVSARLLKMPVFADSWKNSELRGIIQRFAESAYHRYLHLERHSEKTNLKIRN